MSILLSSTVYVMIVKLYCLIHAFRPALNDTYMRPHVQACMSEPEIQPQSSSGLLTCCTVECPRAGRSTRGRDLRDDSSARVQVNARISTNSSVQPKTWRLVVPLLTCKSWCATVLLLTGMYLGTWPDVRRPRKDDKLTNYRPTH